MLSPVAEITPLALQATTTLAVKQAPFQWGFICSLMLSEAFNCLFCSPGNQILTVHLSLSAEIVAVHPSPLSFAAPCPALDIPFPNFALFLQRLDSTWLYAQLLQRKLFIPWFKHRNSECNPGQWKQLWMMPSFTTPPQSSLQGHGELTLPAAMSAWAHPLHKSLLFSFLDVLTLYMHLHVFSQRNSIYTGSIWHFPFNSFKQYLFDRFGV